MRRRYELSNLKWERIQALLPDRRHKGGPGRPWLPHRRLINGILWVLHTGAPAGDVPERYGPWQTVYYRFNRWRQDGTWAKILSHALRRLDKQGKIGRELWMVDGSVIRGSRAGSGARKTARRARQLAGPARLQLKEPPDHALGYSRGGFGTKVHLLVEGHGIVLGIFLTGGQRHESKFFEKLMERVMLPGRAKRWPAKLAGDKGYSYLHVRRWCHKRHVEDVIPTRKDQPRIESFDKATYKKRNLIERVVGWFKECRRLGTRYEKLAVNYLAFWIVACIERYL